MEEKKPSHETLRRAKTEELSTGRMITLLLRSAFISGYEQCCRSSLHREMNGADIVQARAQALKMYPDDL